jgi:tyrosine-specific transport protein
MNSKMIGGILFIPATAIGAGMLALPVVTGFAGFWPTTLCFIFYWALMTYSALLMVEVNLWMEKPGSNMITMAGVTLGNLGKAVSWLAYLFLLYALTTAYLAGSGSMMKEYARDLMGLDVPSSIDALPLIIVFAFLVYRGAYAVDYLNRVLMIAFFVIFVIMVVFLTPHVNTELLVPYQFEAIWVGLSTIATAFGFHVIIPTLTVYLDRNVKMIKRVIIIGSLIPLAFYLVWQVLVLGIVPLEGPVSLSGAYQEGTNGADILSRYLGHGFLAELARAFSLLAVVTSFLGVSMSLCDFFADGFKIPRSSFGNLFLVALTVIPPFFIAKTDPRVFLEALDYAGAFGVIFLLVFFPALMVWKGRDRFASTSIYKTPGGKGALLLVILISLFLIGMEIIERVVGFTIA